MCACLLGRPCLRLSRDEHLLEPRRRRSRRDQLAQPCHPGDERLPAHKALRVEGDVEASDGSGPRCRAAAGGARQARVDQLRAQVPACEHASQHLDRERKAGPLVAAGGKESSRQRGGRIGSRMTLRVERPAKRDRLPVQLRKLDRPPGDRRLREIENEGRRAVRHRGCYRQRVVAEPCLRTAPRCHHRRSARCGDSDQTVLDRAQRVERRSAEVVAAASRHEADAVQLRAGNGLVHAHSAGDRSEGAKPVDGRCRPMLALEPRHGVDNDPAGSGVGAIRGEPNEPMGVYASPIGLDQTVGDGTRSITARAQACDDRLGVGAKRVLRETAAISAHTTVTVRS